MKKLFTLAAAVLASFSLWAADPTLPANATPSTTLDAGVLDETVRCITNAVHNSKQYYVYSFDTVRTEFKAGNVTWVAGPKTDGGNSATISFASDDAEVNYGFTTAGTRAWGINNSRYVGIRVTNCVEFAALTKSNSTKDGKTLYIHVFKKDGETWNFVETLGEGIYDNSKYYVLSASLDAAKEYIILLTSGNSSNCLVAQIRLASPYCTDPELTVSPTEGTGFVGDPINITISSKNQSKPINPAVTVDGVAGVYGTDYTYSASTGLVQATPLKAGKFEITFSQASNDTYCAAEETVTFVISEKTPVTSFKVDGPTKAHIGEEVTLTATDFDAAPTRVWWIDPSTGDVIKEGATYTFTASAVGTVEYYALARNNFNNADEEALDYAAGMFGSVEVTIGTDATLSDLKVNGATIDGFAADKFEYTIAAELGVYEALKVEATAADAPYASAAVVDNGEGKVTVTVTAEDESTQDYVINYTRKEATTLVAVSDSLTWDWAKAGSKTAQFDGTTLPKNVDEFNFADVLSGQDANFKAASIAGLGQYANGGGYAQLNMLKFHADKSGTIVVKFSNTGSSSRPDRVLLVNDVQTEYKSKTSASEGVVTTGKIAIEAGDVVIEALEMKETPAKNMIRIYMLTYVPNKGETAIDNTEAEVKAVKMVENGMLIIKKDGKTYNVLGQTVR